jgi:hypothetical protein
VSSSMPAPSSTAPAGAAPSGSRPRSGASRRPPSRADWPPPRCAPGRAVAGCRPAAPAPPAGARPGRPAAPRTTRRRTAARGRPWRHAPPGWAGPSARHGCPGRRRSRAGRRGRSVRLARVCATSASARSSGSSLTSPAVIGSFSPFGFALPPSRPRPAAFEQILDVYYRSSFAVSPSWAMSAVGTDLISRPGGYEHHSELMFVSARSGDHHAGWPRRRWSRTSCAAGTTTSVRSAEAGWLS